MTKADSNLREKMKVFKEKFVAILTNREHHLMYTAVGLNSLSFLMAVIFGQIASQNIADLQRANRQLHGYLTNLEAIGAHVDMMSGPALGIFHSRDVVKEQLILERAHRDLRKSTFDLAQTIGSGANEEIKGQIDEVDHLQDRADQIFAHSMHVISDYKFRKFESARQRVATVEQKCKELRTGIAALRARWQRQGDALIESQVQSINRMSNWTLGLSMSNVVLLALVIGAGSMMYRRSKILQSESAFYKSALDHVAIVATTDPRGKITYANDNFAKISGYAVEELIGEDHRLLNSGAMEKGYFAEMWKTISAGKTWRGEICNRAKSGRLYWVDSIIVPILNRNRRVEQYTAIRIETTARKEAEESLVKSREAAVEAAKVKSEFLANMSHEIRTPMNGIIGMCALLLDSKLDHHQEEKLKIIQSSSQSLLDIINDVLDFSKVEAGKLELEDEPFSLGRAISDVIHLLRDKASQKGVVLNYVLDPEMPDWVYGDATRFRQILLNLVGNGLKFTSQGSVVIHSLCKERSDGSLDIEFGVKDTGIGIAKDRLDKLFQSFSQADTSTTRRFGGTGLGLAISKAFCEKMGGTIRVESEIGLGSNFIFNIVTRKAPPKVSYDSPAFAEGDAELSHSYPLRILVAEDNKINQIVIKGILSRLGYQPVVVPNGQAALEALKTRDFDLVLMDCHMPLMDGFEATKKIHTLRANLPRPKIIALTASAMKQDIDQCMAVGMDGFLSKPIEIPNLVMEIKKIKPNIGSAA